MPRPEDPLGVQAAAEATARHVPRSGEERESEEIAAEATARYILRSGEGRESAEMPDGLRFLREKEQEQDRVLKLSYATWLRRSLAAQLLVADGGLIAYAWAGKTWNLVPLVINIWLAATVVQVVGIVLVVTRHLFPQRDQVVTSAQNRMGRA
jgi:hypothetical protein